MNDSLSTYRPNDPIRTGVDVPNLQRAFLDHLYFSSAKFPAVATQNDYYQALASTIRDRLLQRWARTARTYYEQASRTVVYLSAEYLLGPHLGNNLLNLGIQDATRQAITELGLDFDALLHQEEEPGLGNGGLGRLAACFLDSLASQQIPAIGYGIRYEFGIFDQAIRNGWQVELTDKWLRYGNPWEIARPEITFPVGFGGTTRAYTDATGRYRVEWNPERVVLGMAYDTPILGYRVNNANMLRLWQAQASDPFDLQAFNVGDYMRSVTDKMISENITKVLYPNDEHMEGKVLRLQQQYLFVSCSLRDMIRIFLQRTSDIRKLNEKFAVQMNDTHPAIAVAELMRLLIDEHLVDWDTAWEITQRTLSYTNHTLLPEALEKWPMDMFGKWLPRHLEIILELNRRFLDDVRARYPGDEDRVRRMSLVEERGGKSIRMAHLATLGSHTVNGVAELHSRLLRKTVLRDFAEMTPTKFRNVTNGVTPRRFIALSNPDLASLITDAIGDGWLVDLTRLRDLEPFAQDASFRERWMRVKRIAKERLAQLALKRTPLTLNPDTLFDVQVKRFHEYKRQHLNVMNIITHYLLLKDGKSGDAVPRTYVFGGKAAPGYAMAKLIIRLIHGVAEVVNSDRAVREQLRVVFIPDFNVQTAQDIYPGADLSEQISTAGKEASGTGNMKFAMNGALTIGTLDGANIEIRREVGEENFFCFGLTAEEIAVWQSRGYDPSQLWVADPILRRVLEVLSDGTFSQGDASLYRPLVENLRWSDPYFVLADYAAYIASQEDVSRAYADINRWAKMSILNTARMGYFSSDRSIREYCRDIWKVSPQPIEL